MTWCDDLRPQAPNTDPFPSQPADFLHNSGLTPALCHALLDTLGTNESDPEDQYPSLELLARVWAGPSTLGVFLTRILGRLEHQGKLLIYGAGTMTASYIETLKANPSIEIVGILDQTAEPGATFFDIPLYQPADHQTLEFDHLLIIHFHWEAEMAATAVACGIPRHKIILGRSGNHANQGYVESLCRSKAQEIREKHGWKPNLTLSTMAPKWSVLDLLDCQHLFPAASTHHVIYAPPGIHLETWKEVLDFPITCPRSRPYLKLLLEALTPNCIYLRVTPHISSEWLPAFVRRILPSAHIVVEYYDMGVLFSDKMLRENIRYHEHQLQLMKAATYAVATGEVDALVVKSGGQRWEALAANIKAAVCPVFPILPVSQPVSDDHVLPPPPSQESRHFRIVYAGSVPITELRAGYGSHPGANMLRYFDTLTAASDITVDLFNAADQRDIGHGNADTRLFEATFRDGPVRYFPSITFDTLLERARDYDFGFTAVHYPNDFTENVTLSGIGNRFMGYLIAGLPVIIDSYFEFQAELILRFNAGIVIEPEKMDDLPRLVREADHQRLRAGVRELRRYMRRENARTFQRLLELLPAKTQPD